MSMEVFGETRLGMDFRQAVLNEMRKRRLAAEWQYELKRRREEEKAREDKERERADGLFIFSQIVLATEQQIEEFSNRLDAYDAAVFDLLRENEEALDRAEAAIGEMRLRAHMLPDGTRVFLTEDGEQVFDEDGTEVTDVVAPDEVDPTRPRWETYRDTLAEQAALEAERMELLEFRDRLDETRERFEEDGLTADALDEMRDALDAEMPEAVRARLRGPEAAEAGLEVNTEPARQFDMNGLRDGLIAAAPPPLPGM